MRYLNSSLFVLVFALLSNNIFCQNNPFDAVFNLKSDDSIDGKNVLIIGVASEKAEGKYKLMVDNVGDAIRLVNGNEVFTGKADSTIRQEHNVPLEINGEGNGTLSAKIYTFTDSMDIDSSSKREFFVQYSVKKKLTGGYSLSFSDVKEKRGPEPSEEATGSNTTPGQLTITDMKQVVEASPDSQQDMIDNQQKFVINTQKRYNSFLRSILFVFSFFILGYLCYRILTKKHSA